MTAGADIRDELLIIVPELRAFAISLTRSGVEADDLVQETVLRAWNNLDRFEPGSNLSAWLFTILRNAFYGNLRRRRREVEDPDGFHSSRMSVAPDQGSHLDFDDLRVALSQLSHAHREVLLLIGAQGFSYEEAARICGCPEGTLKSRLNRARVRLAELLAIGDSDEIGPDQITKAALQAAA